MQPAMLGVVFERLQPARAAVELTLRKATQVGALTRAEAIVEHMPQLLGSVDEAGRTIAAVAEGVSGAQLTREARGLAWQMQDATELITKASTPYRLVANPSVGVQHPLGDSVSLKRVRGLLDNSTTSLRGAGTLLGGKPGSIVNELASTKVELRELHTALIGTPQTATTLRGVLGQLDDVSARLGATRGQIDDQVRVAADEALTLTDALPWQTVASHAATHDIDLARTLLRKAIPRIDAPAVRAETVQLRLDRIVEDTAGLLRGADEWLGIGARGVSPTQGMIVTGMPNGWVRSLVA